MRRAKDENSASFVAMRGAQRLAAGTPSLLGDSGLAQAFKNGLELSEVRRVVGHRRPRGPSAGHDESRVEREAGLDRGMRLVEATELHEGGCQPEIGKRVISVALERTSEPRGRLGEVTEMKLRQAGRAHPGEGHRIAWTQSQGLADVRLCFFGATNINLAQSD